MAKTKDDQPVKRESLFCPFCFQQQFDPAEIQGSHVECEVCGVEVAVKDLVKP